MRVCTLLLLGHLRAGNWPRRTWGVKSDRIGCPFEIEVNVGLWLILAAAEARPVAGGSAAAHDKSCGDFCMPGFEVCQ